MWKDDGVEPRKYDLAVVIGRFQPFHLAHERLIETALEKADKVLIIVGSAHIARNSKNPFSFTDRANMIGSVITNRWSDKNIYIEPIVDQLYNDQLWLANVQNIVEKYSTAGPVCLVGHKKDDSSWYIDALTSNKTWDFVPVPQVPNLLDGTAIREAIYERRFGEKERQSVSPSVLKFLEEFSVHQTGHDMAIEDQFIKKYKSQFEGMKYPPIHNTVDAVVICNGHILLVKRNGYPGKGLWALPGGFLNANETIETAIFRELIEETHINGVFKDTDKAGQRQINSILRPSLKFVKVFDAPGRSLRGRTITHAGLIVLQDDDLPFVKGSDDAKEAKWFPLSEFFSMSDQMFEDHYSVITFMLGRA